jgi:AraC family transcriptional regulator
MQRGGFMDGDTTIRFELVSEGGQQMRVMFARVVNLLLSASRELEHSQEAAKSSIHRAAALLQAQMRFTGTERQGPSQALLAWQMRSVESYIDAHIDQQILVSNLSDLLDLSEAHFSRSFRLAYGVPPHAYIVRRRVELAARLMLASRAPLTEIALKCGFHDQAHLSKQFRQLRGETPAAWRRLRRRPGNVDLRVGESDDPQRLCASYGLGTSLCSKLEEDVLRM